MTIKVAVAVVVEVEVEVGKLTSWIPKVVVGSVITRKNDDDWCGDELLFVRSLERRWYYILIKPRETWAAMDLSNNATALCSMHRESQTGETF